MDAIYDGDDWVDHYTWRLVGSNDNGDVVFDGLCPKHLHPFVSSLIESSARVAPTARHRFMIRTFWRP